MVEFGVLGPLTLGQDGCPRTVPTAMLRRILALLLARAGMPVSADVLIEALWQGKPPQSARRTLSVYVSRLRQLLGADDRVQTHPRGYSIRPEPGELDSAVFEHLAGEAAAARDGGDPDAAASTIRAALALWRGPAYDGLRDIDVIGAEGDRLDQLRLTLFEDGVELDLDAGRHTDVLGPLAKMIVDHPYRERLRGQYMLALHRSGRPADALEVYRLTYQQLTDDLGVEPGGGLQQLHQRILAGDPTLDVARRSSPTRPHLLPRIAAHFTGRHDLLAELDAAADGDGSASPVAILSTITGSAGVGKTALAVFWSRTAGRRFLDGELYINLQGYGGGEPLTPYAAVSHLLRALGVSADDMPADEPAAMARYRSILSNSATLVVLDNANSVSQVRPLLPAGPRCMALVTSRDRLSGLVALDGARRLFVDLLPADESLALLASIVGPDRLGAEPESAAALVEICGRLPLALRIAGAALVEEPLCSIAAYVHRLSTTNRLSQLAIDGDPESSVRHAFSHSYLRLTDAEQRMFRLLGIAPGADIGIPAAAALADCDDTEAGGLLDRLCATHLLSEVGPRRYAFHDLIRDYAVEVGAVDEPPEAADAALDRVMRWYVTQADCADRMLRPTLVIKRAWVDPQIAVPSYADAHAAFAWFDVEGANLLNVIRDVETLRPTACCALVSGVFGWLDGQRRMRDWLEMQSIGIRAAHASGDLAEEAHMRSGLANALCNAGRLSEALPEFERCLEIRRQTNAPARLITSAMMNMGSVLSELARPAESLVYQEQALAIVEQYPDMDDLMSALLGNIGCTHDAAGQTEQAIAYFRRALAMAQLRNDYPAIASTSGNLASSLSDRGEYDEAAALLQAALTGAIALGHLRYQARAHAALGNIAAARGQLEEARLRFRLTMEAYGESPERGVDELRIAISALETGQQPAKL